MIKQVSILLIFAISCLSIGCQPHHEKEGKNKEEKEQKIAKKEAKKEKNEHKKKKHANQSEDESETKKVSSWIRSHAALYWAYAKTDLIEVSPALVPFAKYEGAIIGDPHLANFAPISVRLADGTEVMRYVPIDFDDAGLGPFILDVARLIISSKAAKPSISSSEIVSAYLKGLKGVALAAPAIAQTKLTLEAYRKLAADEVENKTKKGKFKYKEGKIDEYHGPVTRETLAPLFPQMEILDLAQRPRTQGGSAGDMRLWVLVKNQSQVSFIYELKALEPTSLASYRSQPPIEILMSEIYQFYWAGLSSSAYSLVQVSDQGKFWLREKKVSVIDVAYSTQKPEAILHVQQLSNFDANSMGLAHKLQKEGAKLATLLDSEAAQAEFEQALIPFVDAYLEIAEQQAANDSTAASTSD